MEYKYINTPFGVVVGVDERTYILYLRILLGSCTGTINLSSVEYVLLMFRQHRYSLVLTDL